MAVSISAIVPAYQEAESISQAITSIAKALDRIGESFEVLVVDNASTDETVRLAAACAADHPVRVLVNPRNMGKGYSVRRGMLASNGEWRFFCDTDLSTPIAEIGKFYELTRGEFPVLVGSRLATGSYVVQPQPTLRHMVGKGFLGVSHLLCPGLPRDVYCGFKWFRADAADRLFGLQKSTGWVFDLEILALANRLGIQVLEVPIEWENREATRLKMSRDWLSIGVEMARIRLRLSRSVGDFGSLLPKSRHDRGRSSGSANGERR